MVRQRKPPSQTWRTFLDNHVQQLVAIDFLVVPTVSFRLLFIFVVLGHHRRHAIHFNVTAHPTAEWTGRLQKRFRGIARPVICYMIEIAFTEQHSVSELGKWKSAKC